MLKMNQRHGKRLMKIDRKIKYDLVQGELCHLLLPGWIPFPLALLSSHSHPSLFHHRLFLQTWTGEAVRSAVLPALLDVLLGQHSRAQPLPPVLARLVAGQWFGWCHQGLCDRSWTLVPWQPQTLSLCHLQQPLVSPAWEVAAGPCGV